MAGTRSSPWLNRFIWFTAVATLLLICSGGMVTSKGYGLAVPDWPTTFGYNMFMFPASKWIGGVFFEHTHRLAASTVGLLSIVLAIWLWQVEERAWVRLLGVIALAAVILQGILGGLRVAMLRDQIGIFHACLAQAFLALVVFIGLTRTDFWRSLRPSGPDLHKPANLALATTIAIYAQLGLGATMRHQHRDLSLLDFPTANGSWIPDTSQEALVKINAWRDARGYSDVTAGQIWLQMAHRFVAVLIASGVITTTVDLLPRTSDRKIRRLCVLWTILLFVQLALGAWTIWSNKAADIATTHVAVGATMLSLGVIICAVCLRLSQPATMPMPGNLGSIVRA